MKCFSLIYNVLCIVILYITYIFIRSISCNDIIHYTTYTFHFQLIKVQYNHDNVACRTDQLSLVNASEYTSKCLEL